MRSRVVLGIAVLVSSSFAGGAGLASAQGIHFGAGPVHVDVGNPHYSGWNGNSWNRYHGGGFGGGYYGYRQDVYSGGYWGGQNDHSWHDTSHYDYHPGGYAPHGNHYHYMPGHYDFHETGHWHHDHD